MLYSELINKYGTPIYVYNSKELRNRIGYIKSRLNKDYKIIYAVKANTFIINELKDLVDGYEICSYGEYEICSRLKIDVSKYIISGVHKDRDSIKNILLDETQRFTVESINQYLLLRELTEKLDKKIDVLIRLTSKNQFGVSEEDFKKIIELNIDSDNIKIKGLQYFTGTQKYSIKKINKEIDYIISFVKKIEEEHNITLDEIEYGPGSPVFYFREDTFDEEHYFKELNEALSKIKNKKISLELGRSIVASCGNYITSIVDMKNNELGNSIILDGGINHLVYYGQTMAMRKPYFDIYPNRDEDENIYNLYGSLCTVNDVILKNIELNKPQIGDYLVFKNVGAYSITEGISLFLSRNLPNVVICDIEGNYHLVRKNMKTSIINFPNYEKKEYDV